MRIGKELARRAPTLEAAASSGSTCSTRASWPSRSTPSGLERSIAEVSDIGRQATVG